MTKHEKPRAFTILEVVIALSLGVIVIGSITLMLAQVLIANRRQHIVSEFQRDGAFASQVMQQEIRQAGLGVPGDRFLAQDVNSGANNNFVYGAGSSGTQTPLKFIARRVIVARSGDVGIVGDLPRPDANYNAFGPLDNSVTGAVGVYDRTHISWHTENNGSCVETTAKACSSTPGTKSMWYSAATCANGSNATTVTTCAWSNRRIAPGERLQIVDGSGQWSIDAAGATVQAQASTGGGVVGLPLAFDFDLSTDSNTSCTVAGDCAWEGGHSGISDGPQGFIGQGYVTTLDRVFFHINTVTNNLERFQCYGDPDPSQVAWPDTTTAGRNAFPGAAAVAYGAPLAINGLSGKTTGQTCIGPEVIARHLKTANTSFKYFDANDNDITGAIDNNGTLATTLNNIKRVEWVLQFEKIDKQVGTVDFTIEDGTAVQN